MTQRRPLVLANDVFLTTRGPHKGMVVRIKEVRSNSVRFTRAGPIAGRSREYHRERLDVFVANHVRL